MKRRRKKKLQKSLLYTKVNKVDLIYYTVYDANRGMTYFLLKGFTYFLKIQNCDLMFQMLIRKNFSPIAIVDLTTRIPLFTLHLKMEMV